MNAACSSQPSWSRIGCDGSQPGPCTSLTAKLAMGGSVAAATDIQPASVMLHIGYLNVGFCRREVVADVFMSPKTLADLGEVLCYESLAGPFRTLSGP